MEAPVGALGRAFAGEHANWVFTAAAVRIHPAGVGVMAGQIFLGQEHQQLAPASEFRRGDFRNLLLRQRLAVVINADYFVAHAVFVELVGHRFHFLRPFAQQMHSVGRECFHRFLVTLAQQTHRAIRRRIVQIGWLEQGQCCRQFAIANGLQGLPIGLRQIGLRGLMGNRTVNATALLGDFRQITRAVAGNQHGGTRFLQRGVHIRLPIALRADRMEFVVQQAAQIAEHPAHARIIELRGDGRIHRHVLVFHLERHAVALPLLAHVAQGVFRAASVEFIQYHQLGVIEHVDFFQLAGRAEVGGHHIHGEIDQIDDFGIALSDTGGFHDDQIEALPLQAGDGVFQHGIGGHVLAAGRHRAHEQIRRAQAVHTDAVAQQGAAAAAAGRIDRNHRDAHARETLQETVQQLIGDRALAGAAGAGQADDRGFAAGQLPLPAQVL